VSAPRVFVHDITPPDEQGAHHLVPLSETESHHISRVLRLKPGDPIIIFNGRGQSWDADLVDLGKHATARLIKPRPSPAAAPARVTLAIGLIKGDAMDDVVRDVTALGVAEIIPMITAHGVVPKRARGDEAIARWQRVAVASAKQCGQLFLPEISGVTDVAEVLRRDVGTKLMCVEPALGGAEVSAIASDSILILIGPEGGWSAEEVTAARAAGCHTITLGPLTLRAELAPVVAVTRVFASLQT
jgi:16S rRNA (uracil1498-N3)-methyltransferase